MRPMVGTTEAFITRASLTRPRILIASWLRWAASARLAAGLIALRADVFTLHPNFHPLGAIQGVQRRRAYGMLDPGRSLRDAILETRPDLIVSCDDETTLRLHHLLEESMARALPDDVFIMRLIERSFGKAETFGICTSRADLIATAAAAGVRTPRTSAITSWEGLATWLEANGMPAFLKADSTHGGNGVIRISSAAEAQRAWRKLSAPPSPIEAAKYLIKQQDLGRFGAILTRRRNALSVQEAICGHAANCLAVCKGGKLLAYIGVEVDATAKPTGFGTLIRHSANRDMRHAAETLAHRLELNGVFGLDFMIKAGTDEAYLIEMNPRLTPLGHFHFGPGQDPAAALCAIVSNDLTRRERAGAPPPEPIAVFPHMLAAATPAAGAAVFADVPLDQPELMRRSMPLPSNPLDLIAELISRFLL